LMIFLTAAFWAFLRSEPSTHYQITANRKQGFSAFG
jgi:hypothetical protein